MKHDTRLAIVISSKDKEILVNIAHDKRVTMSELIRILIEKEIKNHGK